MMAELFDEEYLRESYNKANRRDAIEKGRAEGKAEGRAEGINQMIESLRNIGMSEEQIQLAINDMNKKGNI